MVGPRNPNDLDKDPGKETAKDAGKDLPAGSKSARFRPAGATRRTAVGLILGAPLLAACSGVQNSLSQFSNPFRP
jgi:hypothetical protein